MLLRGADDLAARPFLGRRAIELGLVPARHGIADVRLVVDREMFPALRVDIGELAAAELLSLGRRKLSHVIPPVRDIEDITPRGGFRASGPFRARGCRFPIIEVALTRTRGDLPVTTRTEPTTTEPELGDVSMIIGGEHV